MITWAIATPLLFGLLLLVLARLEEWVVAPIDRSDRISTLMEASEPDELERVVAEYLAPFVSAARTRTQRRAAALDEDTKPFRIPIISNRPA